MMETLNYIQMKERCTTLREGETLVARTTKEFQEIPIGTPLHFCLYVGTLSTFTSLTVRKNSEYDFDTRFEGSWRHTYTGEFQVGVDETPIIEFGQVVGTPGWAYEIASREGIVISNKGLEYVVGQSKSKQFDHLMLKGHKDSSITINGYHLSGWERKVKTDKELLMKKLSKAGPFPTAEEAYKTFLDISEEYEVLIE